MTGGEGLPWTDSVILDPYNGVTEARALGESKYTDIVGSSPHLNYNFGVSRTLFLFPKSYPACETFSSSCIGAAAGSLLHCHGLDLFETLLCERRFSSLCAPRFWCGEAFPVYV